MEGIDLLGGPTGKLIDRNTRDSIPSMFGNQIIIGRARIFLSEFWNFKGLCSLKKCFEWNISLDVLFTSLRLKKGTSLNDYIQHTGEWRFFIRAGGDFSSKFDPLAVINEHIVTTDKEDIFIVKASHLMVLFILLTFKG